MAIAPLVSFYNNRITNEHCTGDVWSNLPTHGMLEKDLLPGLVITPSCDLANEKVETITYLPIVPVGFYLSHVGAIPDIRGTLLGLMQQVVSKEHQSLISENWPLSVLDVKKLLSGLPEGVKGKQLEKVNRFRLFSKYLLRIIINCLRCMKLWIQMMLPLHF